MKGWDATFDDNFKDAANIGLSPCVEKQSDKDSINEKQPTVSD